MNPLVVLLIVLIFIVGNGDPVDGAQTLLNSITRGKRLTHATYGSDGVVNIDPQTLADQAGTSLAAYALARMISSEEGNKDPVTKAAIGLVAMNYAARHGQTVDQLLLHATNTAHDGYFGTQKDIDPDSARKGKSDRYASTAADPYAGDLTIAEGIVDGSLRDFTGGAIQFDNVAAFDTPEDAARIGADRVAAGRVQVYPPGVDPDLRFWA